MTDPTVQRAPAALALVALLTGCGAAPSPCDEGWRGPYPSGRFLAAAATGADAAQAADAARAAVAAQVASRIDATVEVVTAEVDGVGSGAVRQVVRTRARFDRAELIRVQPVAACETAPHRAVAVLSRAEAAEALAPAWRSAHQRLQGALDRAAAVPDGDGAAFTVAWRAAQGAYADAEAAAVPLAVVAGEVEGQRADREAFAKLQQRGAAVRAAHPVSMDLSGLAPALQGPMGQALGRGLVTLGLQARPGATCEVGLALAPTASVVCDRSPLGPRCALVMGGALARCGGGAVATLDLRAAKLAAVHPRSRDAAEARLLQKLSQADLSAALAEALGSVLPVQAP